MTEEYCCEYDAREAKVAVVKSKKAKLNIKHLRCVCV
jgi:hypothetical protein